MFAEQYYENNKTYSQLIMYLLWNLQTKENTYLLNPLRSLWSIGQLQLFSSLLCFGLFVLLHSRSCQSFLVLSPLFFSSYVVIALVFCPWRFQSNASLVMLFVGFLQICPIHYHALLLICSSAGSWLVRFISCLFEIFRRHQTRHLCLRHLLVNTLIFCSRPTVNLQVSHQ